MSKAFDSVPHERLILKLNRFGIDGKLLSWLRNFLTERQQRVCICGSFSNWTPVLSGVPQGSVLGPVLFLVYVNDIPNVVTSSTKLFADDTKIYRELTRPKDINELQLDLVSLEKWASNWQVKFNQEKCEVLKITHKRDKIRSKYYISNKELKNVQDYKDLGVIVKTNLKWSKHIESIVNKANKTLGLITRTLGGRNKDIFPMLYKSLVRPVLEYACSVWDPHLVKDIKMVEAVQRRASRINCTGSKEARDGV